MMNLIIIYSGASLKQDCRPIPQDRHTKLQVLNKTAMMNLIIIYSGASL
jgi:hypothetical protein